MRREMIETTSRQAALKSAPWAAKVVRVEGGYMAFESLEDWRTWTRQR